MRKMEQNLASQTHHLQELVKLRNESAQTLDDMRQYLCIHTNKKFLPLYKPMSLTTTTPTPTFGPPQILDPKKPSRPTPQPLSSSQKYSNYVRNARGMFPCNFCNREFKTKDGVIGHENAHTGNVFMCRHCAKKYKNKRGLERHLLVHSGKSQYAKVMCAICDKTFEKVLHRDNHYDTHCLGKAWLCPIPGCPCPEFRQRSNFNNHIKRHHKALHPQKHGYTPIKNPQAVYMSREEFWKSMPYSDPRLRLQNL